MWKLLKSTKGQMTIFVALIFQVLFVFFAMAINIGLVVHDKINLQNSVDIAAYYGAQKMAEVMSAMSHVNFQIRQDYKLLAYRMRVVGGLGYDQHPRRQSTSGPESLWNAADTVGLAAGCVAFRSWKEVVDNQQNICRSQGHVIRELPRLPVIAGFLPINAIVSAFVDRVRDFITQECRGKTELNWNYVAGSFYAYRIDMYKRKEAFKALAANLSRSGDEVLDMDGSQIRAGVQRTLRANLTFANRDSLSNFEFYNGLQSDITSDVPEWIAEKLITPQLFYVFHDGRSGGCTNRVKSVRDVAGVSAPDPAFLQNAAGEPNTPRFHSSLGFEKNPWHMAYVGVKATSAPRKPFAPFGGTVRMTARAFAKPFGGTIGPWHKRSWGRGANLSGTGAGEVDTLVVPRIAAPGGGGGNSTGSGIYPYVPNYAKYPGDKLGLKSRMALTFTPGFSSAPDVLSVADFSHFTQLRGQSGDPLSREGSVARQMEFAAIAPDLFDAIYYNVDPRFNDIYGSRGIWGAVQSPNGGETFIPYDIGSVGTSNVQNATAQINAASSAKGNRFYFITDPTHLLTAWHQKGESDYTLDPDRFGQCETPVPDGGGAPPNPGACVKGGRSGYSVKLVSRDYLLFDGHEIGGPGGGSGEILNPPPEDF